MAGGYGHCRSDVVVGLAVVATTVKTVKEEETSKLDVFEQRTSVRFI